MLGFYCNVLYSINFWLVFIYRQQLLTYTLLSPLGWGIALMKGPTVTLATVERPFVEVKVTERRLNATPLKWHEVFICSDMVNKNRK